MDLNLGTEVRELKLGATFTNPNSKNALHTLKYDFKPASVDQNKEATLQTGSNNQVTVTVPHMDGSGVPNTVFKGNQREYTRKECVLIINRETNEIYLEKLQHNIQVKKTRTDVARPPPVSSNNVPPPIGKVENQTARHSSKTRVSTGVRRNVVSFVGNKHSPHQGSPNNNSGITNLPSNYPHRSPHSAPLWNANNTQQTLPSIPLIGLDDTNDFPNSKSSNSAPPPSSSSSQQQNQVERVKSNIQPPQQIQQIQQLQQVQQIQQMPSQQPPHEDVGVLSTSESSSSNSNSDDSDSDSEDSANNEPSHQAINNNSLNINNNHNNNNISSNLSSNIKKTNSSSNSQAPSHHHLGSTTEMLREDLNLSDSNSDSDY